MKSCYWGHKWSLWTDNVNKDTGMIKTQFRRCKRCNVLRTRFI